MTTKKADRVSTVGRYVEQLVFVVVHLFKFSLEVIINFERKVNVVTLD